MNELFKLATFALKDGFGALSTLTVSVNEKDLSLLYTLGCESLSNLGIKKDKAELPVFISHGGLATVEDVRYLINTHSFRSVVGETVSPVIHEFEMRAIERLIEAEERG